MAPRRCVHPKHLWRVAWSHSPPLLCWWRVVGTSFKKRRNPFSRPFMFGEIFFRYIMPQEAPWDDIPPQSLLQFKFLNGIVKLISWIPLQYRSQCLFNAITNMKNCKLYTEMINDEEFVLFYQIKDRTFPGKTKFIWKYSQNLLKLKLQTWYGDEIPLLEDSTFSL